MGTNRLEQIIDEIYEFVESCKPVPLSQNKVMIPKDELFDLLDELKLRTPDEIKRLQKIIANKDSIIADAEEKARNIIEEAKRETDKMINESDVMQEAYRRSEEMISRATAEADKIILDANTDASQIRTGALSYAEDMLGEVEKVVGHAYESARSRCDGLVETLKNNLEVLSGNRNEISAQLNGMTSTTTSEEDDQGDYNFDENTFLEDIEDDE